MPFRKGLYITILLLTASFTGCERDPISPEPLPEPRDLTLQEVLKKPNLKVLDIGNSYTNGAVAFLPQIVKTSDVDVSDMCLYKLVRGSASFKNWCDVYDDKDTGSYSFSHVVGDLEIPIQAMKGTAGDGSVFRSVLTDVEWDVIIIHQYSKYAPYYEDWRGHGAGGYLNEFLRIIKDNQPNAHIGFLLIHSYWDAYQGNTEQSSYLRWDKIAQSVKRVTEEYAIDYVIPYGTAVENIRKSSFNNEFDMTTDGSHCGRGLCRYTASCCYYESLLAPRTGVSCYGNAYRYEATGIDGDFPAISVSDANALLAQTAAVKAVTDMFHCNNPEHGLN